MSRRSRFIPGCLLFLSTVFLCSGTLFSLPGTQLPEAALLAGPTVEHSPAVGYLESSQEKEGEIQLSDDARIKTRLIKKVNPKYPDEAKKEGIAGKVVLQAKVDKEGRVAEVKVQESPHEMLSSAAVDAVVQWVYEPGELNGEPVEFLITITINFQLK